MTQFLYLPNHIAKRVLQLARKHDAVGLNPDETHEALDMAQTYAKIPRPTLMKLPMATILGELGGLVNNDQYSAAQYPGE